MNGEPPPILPYRSASWPQYVSGHQRAVLAIVGVVASIAVTLCLIGALWVELAMIQREIGGEEISESVWDAIYLTANILGALDFLVFIVAAVFVLIWLHRVHKNLGSLGSRGMRFTPGWAVGYWFIPILNLFRPFQVVREVWKASDPASPHLGETGWADLRTPARIGWWWGLWLASGVQAFVGSAVAEELVYSPEGEQIGIGLIMASHVLAVAAGVLFIGIVRGIDERQEEKFRQAPGDANAPRRVVEL